MVALPKRILARARATLRSRSRSSTRPHLQREQSSTKAGTQAAQVSQALHATVTDAEAQKVAAFFRVVEAGRVSRTAGDVDHQVPKYYMVYCSAQHCEGARPVHAEIGFLLSGGLMTMRMLVATLGRSVLLRNATAV